MKYLIFKRDVQPVEDSISCASSVFSSSASSDGDSYSFFTRYYTNSTIAIY